MSDRPTPEDVIDGLECGWCTTSLYGGSIVSALHDAGYVIVSANDAAKLNQLQTENKAMRLYMAMTREQNGEQE